MTSIDMSTLATPGSHDVRLSFAGTGKLSYNLVSRYDNATCLPVRVRRASR